MRTDTVLTTYDAKILIILAVDATTVTVQIFNTYLQQRKSLYIQQEASLIPDTRKLQNPLFAETLS